MYLTAASLGRLERDNAEQGSMVLTGSRFGTMTSRTKATKGRMFTNGKMGSESIPAATIRLGRAKGVDMNEWDDLVEATIDSIHVDASKKEVQIDLMCAWGTRERKRISATGVDDFIVSEMRLSNVIDRVSRVDAEEAKKYGLIDKVVA